MSDAELSPAQLLLTRLREPGNARAQLIELSVDAIATRPVHEALPAEWLANAIAEGIQAAAAAPELEAWLRRHIERAATRIDSLQGTAGDHIPLTIMAPAERILSRDLQPDAKLVRVFIDHPSFRQLAAAVLQAQLTDFAKRLKTMVPAKARPSSGRGLASAFAGVAKGVASAVTSEVERQLDDRVTAFVQETIGRVVDGTIDHLCDPDRVDEMAQWRIDVFRELMSYPLEAAGQERHRYPPAQLAADLADIVRVLSEWRQLSASIERAIASSSEAWEGMSVASFLDGSGVEDVWRNKLSEV
ncbi:MAG: hypothetical protein ACPHRO_09805, partial [Nannocystaceae bacterium]